MASDIWLRTILIVRKETCCRHIGYSYRLTARVLLYAPSHRQDNTYHSLCYTSRGALAGTRNSSMGSPPWRIDPTTHRTMSERSTSELHPAPTNYLKKRREIFIDRLCFLVFLGHEFTQVISDVFARARLGLQVVLLSVLKQHACTCNWHSWMKESMLNGTLARNFHQLLGVRQW